MCCMEIKTKSRSAAAHQQLFASINPNDSNSITHMDNILSEVFSCEELKESNILLEW
jgi:hypothetical protein